ncbi:guanylate kinase [Pelagophyceae sp. CCMP2097]|nr:guanylate kinase [Pelagophyceae sp. CCMP2097]|mmetsp:Transcript_18380/g.61938  ORF Transcript_18380/g.61938 Transcript_18380/m.61938 type:complete len:265 (+) Transcript_18380:93-887(+)
MLRSALRVSLSVHSFAAVARGMSMRAPTTLPLKCGVSLLCAADAAQLDKDLMSSPGFSLDQLMELAGLSVAASVHDAFPLPANPKVLVVAGPGNNGGDGLVAARHLTHFGYKCDVVYPKRPANPPLFGNLVRQLEDVGVDVAFDLPADLEAYNVIVDAVFGFSFSGAVRAPFAVMLEALANEALERKLVAVDVPSGWSVDGGPPEQGVVLKPSVLISLTAPKLCAVHHSGRHYLGGRFLPPAVAKKYNLQLPKYPGADQCVLLE